mgnify:CR=1 FL=1
MAVELLSLVENAFRVAEQALGTRVGKPFVGSIKPTLPPKNAFRSALGSES